MGQLHARQYHLMPLSRLGRTNQLGVHHHAWVLRHRLHPGEWVVALSATSSKCLLGWQRAWWSCNERCRNVLSLESRRDQGQKSRRNSCGLESGPCFVRVTCPRVNLVAVSRRQHVTHNSFASTRSQISQLYIRRFWTRVWSCCTSRSSQKQRIAPYISSTEL